MVVNRWNSLHICLFGQTQITKQRATLSPENLENKSNFDSWGLTLVAYKKGVNQDYFLQSFDVIVNALTERVFR